MVNPVIRKTKLKHFLKKCQGFKLDSLIFRIMWSLFFFPSITNAFLLASFRLAPSKVHSWNNTERIASILTVQHKRTNITKLFKNHKLKIQNYYYFEVYLLKCMKCRNCLNYVWCITWRYIFTCAMGDELRDGNKVLNSHNESFLKNCNVFVITSKTTKNVLRKMTQIAQNKMIWEISHCTIRSETENATFYCSRAMQVKFACHV